MASTVPSRSLYVAGKWVQPIKGGTLPVICPATEEIIGQIPAATPEDVNHCITQVAAIAKAGSWTKTTGLYRASFLRAIAQKVIDYHFRPPCAPVHHGGFSRDLLTFA